MTLVARTTKQTYVDVVKAKNADGKLTKEEAAEAFRRTVDESLNLLKREGIEVGKDVLRVVVEAVSGPRGLRHPGLLRSLPGPVRPGVRRGPERELLTACAPAAPQRDVGRQDAPA